MHENLFVVFTILKNRILIIDGNYVLHRSFWGIRPLYTENNEPINAVYGFFSTLFKLIRASKAKYLAITFDSGKVEFRIKKIEGYKANRPPMDDELFSQLIMVQKILKECEMIPFIEKGYEADDIIATIVEKMKQSEHSEVLIYSADNDLKQLLSDKVHVIHLVKGKEEIEIEDTARFKKKWGIDPIQIIDFKSLCGDPSDNIKGVKGIGKVTALKLLQEHKDIDGIYNNIEKIKESTQKKLLAGKDDAYIALEVNELVKEVPINFNKDSCHLSHINFEKLLQTFEDLRFYTLLKRIQPLLEEFAGKIQSTAPLAKKHKESREATEQMKLF